MVHPVDRLPLRRVARKASTRHTELAWKETTVHRGWGWLPESEELLRLRWEKHDAIAVEFSLDTLLSVGGSGLLRRERTAGPGDL